ncbi:hypothetical protein GDO86_009556 [Hymenochirus boettgeri]|uniref:DH domain-containing protein n=1 Tax=Hymenochirus boettgeri TaxID=247094 RepID=A0A8T2JLS1_9PIPI|nr:hypothetical protein GDO86_009556 [Hymenochirus boettgeri]
MCSQTRFSAWTPISSKSSNKQLFYERVNLIGHWFDLWTDKQRREFLYSILMKSSKSQLKFVRDWFAEEVPVTKLDFTTVLPRFISLYIFCFLNPHDLCTAAQVSWHWKFLTEQDCLWMPKCTKFGWFLPYTPSENEYGAWKSHYIKCACTLDYLTPREAAETYGTLNEPKEGIEEEEEKLKEKIFRKILREKLALHKILISSMMPAYEVVLDSVKSQVIPVVYDFCGMTPESLLFYVEKALSGCTAQSIGIVTDGDSQNIHLLQSCQINMQNILSPEIRDFWEKLGSCVVPRKEGGHIDVFVPLAASESGMEILDTLSQMTGVTFSSPTGITTGSYLHILSEWLAEFGSSVHPPNFYFHEVKFQAWCRLADIMEEALHMVRKQMKQYLGDLKRNISGRLIGKFMSESMTVAKFQANHLVAMALTDGLVELSQSSYQEDSNENVSPEITSPPLSENELRFQQLTFLENKLLTNKGDKRTRFAREIVRSEKQYVQTLEIIKKVYVVPLKAALSSNRAILSFSNVQIIFSDIMEIFKINKHFLKELTERLQEWGPSECLGDIFMKFGSQLHKYTNFFNNYSVILKTIDKCRESMPSFRAFLKRHDQTVLTKMMSIQEMMLLPSSRFEEYVNLLYAIRLHTSPDHSDRKDLSTAIGQMKHYKDYISQLKASLDKDEKMTRIQKSIQGCPNLVEDNRHLIRLQDVSLLTCPDEEISVPLRIYEHISDLSLFLFNDALVISSRHTSYAPFLRSPKTSYQFMASVSLPRLLVEDIPDSKYVQNAFVLRGPKRKWICSAVSEEEKFTWLSVSQSAICASIEKC